MNGKRERIEIKNHYDLDSIINDMFEEFLESLITKEWAIKHTDIDDDMFQYENNFEWYYTEKGQNIVERYKNRMQKIFDKYFPDEFLIFRSTLYVSE